MHLFRKRFGFIIFFAGVFLFSMSPEQVGAYADEYEFVMEFGCLGTGPGQFGSELGPRGIVVTNDFIFVGDYGNQRIQKFTLDGEYISHWASGYVAQLAVTDVFLYQLCPAGYLRKWTFYSDLVTAVPVSIPAWSGGMAMDNEGNLQVSISVDKKVKKYNANLDYLGEYPSGDGVGGDIQASPDGHVYFSTEQSEIARFTNDGNDTGWRRNGTGVTVLAIDHDGEFALRAHTYKQVQLYNESWNLVTTIGSPEGGSGPGEFGWINEMCVAPNGYLYITDGAPNYRVQVFKPVENASRPLQVVLDMPSQHYYADDPFQLNCILTPATEEPVTGRLFVLLETSGAYYYYPSWRSFNWLDLLVVGKDEWSVAMTILDDTTEIIIEEFKMPFFPFPMTCRFMSTFTDEDVTCLMSNIDEIIWGFGGEP